MIGVDFHDPGTVKGLFLLTQVIVFGIFLYYLWLVEVIWPEELEELEKRKVMNQLETNDNGIRKGYRGDRQRF